MMLAFITSMRHPDNADNYAYNEELLSRTLDSLANQSSDDYVVYVVGNRAPSFALPPRVHFIPVDFPPPARVKGPHADRDGFVRDKGTKIAIGLIAAQRHSPDFVMIFDADDFLHRDLTSYVNSRPSSQGWVIERGWIYSNSRNGYRRQDGFNGTCGTSYIIPFEAYGVPVGLDVDAHQDELITSFGDTLPSIMGAHRNAVSWHAARGRSLEPLPFRGAVYHVDTGENHSGKALAGLIRPWEPALERTFAIASARSPMSTLIACLGPRALAQSTWVVAKRALGPIYRAARKLVRRTSD